jgi:putative glutamine amidotransferase
MNIDSNHGLLIGVSSRIHYPLKPDATDRTSTGVWSKHIHYLEQSVGHWVQSAGALPVLVPPGFAGVTATHYGQALDGLVLQGGNDVAPPHYGEAPLHDDWHGDAVRDQYELDLIRAFVAAGKPVFGICRGLQLLNVCFGGSLYQDINTQLLQPQSKLQLQPNTHRELGRYENHFHPIEFVPGTHLAGLYPQLSQATTNSIHHQGIKDLAPEFIVEARCPEDGLIEAVRWRGPSYVAAVQWHPEFHRADDPNTLDDGPMLRDFLAAVQRMKSTR